MLDQLVESKKNSAENKRLGKYLVTTFVLIFTLCLSGVLWSLFAKEFGMGNADLELANIVAPIPVNDEKPDPEPEIKTEKNLSNQPSKETTRQTNTKRVEESPTEISEISVTPNKVKARPAGEFKLSPGVETDYRPARNSAPTGDEDTGFAKSDSTASSGSKPEIKTYIPPPPVKQPKVEEKKNPTTVSLGVVNGKASNLPKPPYPPTARAVGASGAVNVQVLIDEDGGVVSAKAVSGHPLLRQAAEDAARRAKFTPTKLSNVPVKVNGLIVYNFTKN